MNFIIYNLFTRKKLFLILAVLAQLIFSPSVFAETRIALVIGNADYQSSGNLLDNPVNDAELMGRTLKSVGFDVTTVINANRFQMEQAMIEYSRSLTADNTVGVFYYAGHGMQVDGQNYLMPVDASPARKDELSLYGVALGDFLRTLNSVSGQKGRLNIVILDACRDNPFARGWRSVSKGLATIDAPSGTLIAFATAPGAVAADGDGVNSPYTKALVQMIKKPGLPIELTFKGARKLVWEWTKAAGQTQIPWESTSLRGDFYFLPPSKFASKNGEELNKEKTEKSPAKEIAKVEDGNENKSVKKTENVKEAAISPLKKLKLGECYPIQSAFKRPLQVYSGLVLCSSDQTNKALIKRIRKRGITYSVNGGYEITCTIKDLCQFNWRGAPLFRVKINNQVSRSAEKPKTYAGFLVAAE